MWTQKMPLSGLTVALTFEKFCPRPEYKPLLVLTLIGKSWKTHPEYFPKFQFTGHEPRRVTGKFVQGWPKIESSKKWMSFPVMRPPKL